MTLEEINELREKVRCPQFGYEDYGQWGALRLEQRLAIRRLCDEVEYHKKYFDNDKLHVAHKYILDTHSFDEQLKHMYTEICELTAAIYAGKSLEEIAGELADCYNFLDQVAMHFGFTKQLLTPIQVFKSERTIEEMKGKVRRNEKDIKKEN